MTPEDQDFFRSILEIDMELFDLELQDMQRALKPATSSAKLTVGDAIANMKRAKRHHELTTQRLQLINNNTQSAVLYELFFVHQIPLTQESVPTR